MEGGNRLCSRCGLSTAEVFCTDQEIILCDQCLSKHTEQESQKGYLTRPPADLLSHKDPKCVSHQEALLTIQAQARQGVVEVDTAITQYRALVAQVLQEIQTSSERTIDQLIDIKTKLSADIEDALEEVEKTLDELQPKLHSKYGPAFRALVEKPEPFKLFMFTAPSCLASVKSLVTLQYSLLLPEELLESAPSHPPQVNFLTEHDTPCVAEAHYLESIQMCSVHFPQTLELAICYHNLGKLYQELHRLEQAEIQYQQAISLYQFHFPDSVEFANCLELIGSLYREMKRYVESEAIYLKAIPIYSSHFSQEFGYAICLANLGILYKEMQRYEQAEIQLLQAILLFQARFSRDLSFANSLKTLGDLYRETAICTESEAMYLQALPIYATYFSSTLNYAAYLTNVGLLYYDMKLYEQGEREVARPCTSSCYHQ